MLYLHSSIVAPYLLKYGSDYLQSRYIPGAVSAETILGIAMTEPDAGRNLSGMRSRAVDTGDHCLLNGSKTYISNGGNGDVFVVAACTDVDQHHGINLFVVEADWEGFSRGAILKIMGMKSQNTAVLFFTNVRVPKSHRLGEENQGFSYLMDDLAQERLICAIWNTAAAEHAFYLTRDFVCKSEVFGRSLSEQQNTRFKFAELRVRIDMMQAFADARIIRIFAGTSEIMKLIIARSIFDSVAA